MQEKHMYETRVEGRSYFVKDVTAADLQSLLNNNHTMGAIRITKSGQIKETIICDDDIAVNVSNATGEESYTNKVTVHYSKTRTHIVPSKR